MVNEYINYFRSLAISHKDIQHDPNSDTGDMPTGEKHFTRISVEEVLTGLQDAVHFPLLSIELYEVRTKAEAIMDIKTLTSGAFMVIDDPVSALFADMQNCYAKSEQIVYDLLKKIWQDHYGPSRDMCTRPFRFFDFDKLAITPVGPVFSGQHGYRVEFNFQLQNTYDITRAPEAGTFL